MKGRRRGGRGRGRSITQDLVRDNLDDLGLQTSGEDNDEPLKNYPHVSISTPIHPAGEQVFLIEKCRDIAYRFERSYTYIAKNAEEDGLDVSLGGCGHSGMQNGRGKKRTMDMMEYMEEEGIESTKYISAELIEKSTIQRLSSSSSSGNDKRSNNKDINLGMLERQERIEKAARRTEAEVGSDLEGDGEEQDDIELDDDYGVDHYADSDGGGDVSDDGQGEAVF